MRLGTQYEGFIVSREENLYEQLEDIHHFLTRMVENMEDISSNVESFVYNEGKATESDIYDVKQKLDTILEVYKDLENASDLLFYSSYFDEHFSDVADAKSTIKEVVRKVYREATNLLEQLSPTGLLYIDEMVIFSKDTSPPFDELRDNVERIASSYSIHDSETQAIRDSLNKWKAIRAYLSDYTSYTWKLETWEQLQSAMLRSCNLCSYYDSNCNACGFGCLGDNGHVEQINDLVMDVTKTEAYNYFLYKDKAYGITQDVIDELHQRLGQVTDCD